MYKTSILKIKIPGITQGVRWKWKKVSKKVEKKNDCRVKNFCGEEGSFIRMYHKTGETDFDQLQDMVQVNNEDTNSRVMSWLDWKGWFLERGRTIDRHKIRCGWYLGLGTPISSIVGMLILYSKNMLGG